MENTIANKEKLFIKTKITKLIHKERKQMMENEFY